MSSLIARADPAGYLSAQYADSLTEWGRPVELRRSGGWLLARRIPGTEHWDAMGCYPLFCCLDWRGLQVDLDELRPQIVSVTLVTDPFGDYDEALLRSCFDRADPFKQHYVSDLTKPVNELANFHHRKHAKRARKDVEIEVLGDAGSALDQWVSLYATLTNRHAITGIRAFSRESFVRQLAVPGLVAIRAKSISTGDVTGMQLWFAQGPVVYSHLSAYSDVGYKQRVAYALNWQANEYFTGRVPWLLLGAGAGTGAGVGGLTDYKRGWSTDTRQVWLCGKVLQPETYAHLSQQAGAPETAYFPAYRHGEF